MLKLSSMSPPSPAYNQLLLNRLRPLVAPSVRGTCPCPCQLFRYCCLDREHLRAIVMPHPVIGIVLRGEKEVWHGDRHQRFRAGQVFVLPRGVRFDVVNIPDARQGQYETLLLEVSAPPADIRPVPALDASPDAGLQLDLEIPLTADLVEVLVHAATAIADTTAGETLKRLRLSEILALLRSVPAARPLFHQPLSHEVASLIRSEPAHDWQVHDVAARLGMSASSLRRKLAQDGRQFRLILREQRLKAAQAALQNGASSREAADAAGYNSRSHFARRFRQSFGATPRAHQPA